MAKMKAPSMKAPKMPAMKAPPMKAPPMGGKAKPSGNPFKTGNSSKKLSGGGNFPSF